MQTVILEKIQLNSQKQRKRKRRNHSTTVISTLLKLEFQGQTDAKVEMMKKLNSEGRYAPWSKTIQIDTRYPYATQVAVLFHEIGHHECCKKKYCPVWTDDRQRTVKEHIWCECRASLYALRMLRKRKMWESLAEYIRRIKFWHQLPVKNMSNLLDRRTAQEIIKRKEFQSAVKACCGAGMKINKK